MPRAQMTQSLFGQSLHPKYPKWLGSTYLQCIAVLWQLCGWKTVQSWWEIFLHTDMSVNVLHHIESILFVQSHSFRAWLRLCWVQAKPWALPSCQQGPAQLRLLGLSSQGLTAWSQALHITTQTAMEAFASASGNFHSFPAVICQRPFDQSHALIWFFQTR